MLSAHSLSPSGLADQKAACFLRPHPPVPRSFSGPQTHPSVASAAPSSSTSSHPLRERLRRRSTHPVKEPKKTETLGPSVSHTADATMPTTSWQAKADAFLSTLNAEQMKAAKTDSHAVRIKAGPGSGKTRVVAARVAWLLRSQVPPTQLLVITFTNKAAGELKERIAGILGPTMARGITAGTFHSICARILRRNVELLKCGLTDEFTIYEPDDAALLIKRFLEEHNEYGNLSNAVRGKLAKALCDAFSKVKNMVPTTFGTSMPEVFKTALARREIALPPFEGVNMARLKDPYQLAGLFATYNSKLRGCNAVDFDDLLGLTVALLKRKDVQSFYNNKFKCVLVDEFQDTNEPQYALSRLLKGNSGSLFVVGDPDQAVYSWRGANPSIFLDSFAQQYRDAATYFLNTNHRSGAHILQCAEAVLSHNGLPHMHETLNSARPGGPGSVHHITVLNEYAEAMEVASQIKRLRASNLATFKDMAVLYRTKAQAFLLKKQLTASGIPYVVLGDRSLWEKAEIKDAMAFLRLVTSPLTDSVALERVINKPARGIGDTLLKKLKASATEQDVSLTELLFKDCAQVWMPRTAVEAKLQEIKLTVEQCRRDFYQGKKDSQKGEKKVLSQDKAKEIIERVKTPLTRSHSTPDLSSLPLPAAAIKNPGAQGLRQLRELVVLARNVARYTDNLGDVILVCMEATGYVLDLMNEGGSKNDLDVLMTMANHDEVWLTEVDANLSQLDAPNNLAAQYLAGATVRTGVIEVVDESAGPTVSKSVIEAVGESGGDSQQRQQQQLAAQVSMVEHPGRPSFNGDGGSKSEHISKGDNNNDNIISMADNSSVAMPGGANDVQDDPQLSTIRKFLEHAALVSDMEDRKDSESLDRVSLMTLHTSKGLEFNTVFVAGFEDGLCPYERGGEDDESRLPTDYEEEKRLAYVGATRAKEQLFFLSAQQRHKQERNESRYTRMLKALSPGTLHFHLKGVSSAGKPSPYNGGTQATGGRLQHGESINNDKTNSTKTRGGSRSTSRSMTNSASNMTSSTRTSRGSSRSNSSRSSGSRASRSTGTASQTSGSRSVKPANGW